MGKSQSRWSRLLRRGSAGARLLGLRVRTLPRHGCSCVSVVYCHVEVSATGRLLVHSSPTESGVSECDLETSIMKRPRPIEGRWATKKKKTNEKTVSVLAPYTGLMLDIFWFSYNHLRNNIIVSKLRLLSQFRYGIHLNPSEFIVPFTLAL